MLELFSTKMGKVTGRDTVEDQEFSFQYVEFEK